MTRLPNRTAADAKTLSRRSFLIGVAGTGVAFGFAATEGLAATTSAPVTDQFDPTIWYSIDRDGIVTVIEIGLALFIERGGRFVEKQPVGRAEQRPRDREPLLLAAGKAHLPIVGFVELVDERGQAGIR